MFKGLSAVLIINNDAFSCKETLGSIIIATTNLLLSGSQIIHKIHRRTQNPVGHRQWSFVQK